ncbi:DNA-binding protein [Nocardia sp. NPDC050175]|uniref:DNA-binding protein n=1 Tax=Nocardia sp. NPDC050175 TaxID=3364317 RepID=UPI00378DBFA1
MPMDVDVEGVGANSPRKLGVEEEMAARTDVCELATPAEAAGFLRTTVAKLANDRYMGVGPGYVKYGRSVLYPWKCLRAFVDEHTVRGL